MSSVRPPKGMRDFAPVQMRKRNYIFHTISQIFAAHGLEALETPSMENLSTLTGKYGDEGDQLLYKVINSGDFLKDVSSEELNTRNLKKLAPLICEKGLRYDLTVPFARYVAQNHTSLPIPFKRYQIQPVWRADRPQKGRYREFYQCDADIVGTTSLQCEVEMMEIFFEVFTEFKLIDQISICVNNRKILQAVAEVIGAQEKLVPLTVAIDKLDKMGIEQVKEELNSKGIDSNKLNPLFAMNGTNQEKLKVLSAFLASSETGQLGLRELEYVLRRCEKLGIHSPISLTPTLARGLSYYTGLIYEVKLIDASIGTIASGGRYDNLTELFGVKGLSGIGLSFGADRIYDVLEEKSLFPPHLHTGPDVLALNQGEESLDVLYPLCRELRRAGFKVQLYSDDTKIKKQMKYANTIGHRFVAIVGEDEINQKSVSLKNMGNGDQQLFSMEKIDEIIKFLKMS